MSVVSESAAEPEESAAPVENQSWEPEQAVTVLSSFSASSVPSMAGLEDGRVFCCWTDFATDGEDSGTGVCIVDLAADAVEDMVFFDQYLEYKRTFSDGNSLFLSYQDDSFYLMDEALELTKVDTPQYRRAVFKRPQPVLLRDGWRSVWTKPHHWRRYPYLAGTRIQNRIHQQHLCRWELPVLLGAHFTVFL
ncbi:MAG: hypothetical protein LUC48_06420 [Clostridiales bacterium]|nr:hypothetical protein [Clostridiales bacterium]